MTRRDFDRVWRVLDGQVASGRIPGYVAAVSLAGEAEVRAGGRMAVDGDSPPMREDTLFRIASMTKPIGGALSLSLVQDGVLGLDDPIERWLPEAALPRVLDAPGSPLDRTVEARRPITVRDLVCGTSGWGAVLEAGPLQQAMMERDVYPGPLPPRLSADEFAARVCDLPLAFQPGEGWLYDTGIDLAGVLLARAAGRPLSELVAERVTGPLGMASTSFGARDVSRLATAYRPVAAGLEVLDPPDGLFAGPAAFEQLASGLVSTAPDLLRFFTAMASGGAPVLGPGGLAVLTADALTDAQRRQAEPIVGPGASWALATAVDVAAPESWMAPGRWGWTGGTGTDGHVDPARDTVAILLTQRAMTGPLDRPAEFWTAVAEAATAG
jgi:CubicO group peptidase (beta-lactamase class C family)